MTRKKGPKKVTAKEFASSAESFIGEVKELDGPLMITDKGRPAAYLISAARYEEDVKKLAAFERISKALDEADRVRMEAHAKTIARIATHGRKD